MTRVSGVDAAAVSPTVRAPASQADLTQVSTMTSAFKAGGYKYKPLFAAAAVYCMGS